MNRRFWGLLILTLMLLIPLGLAQEISNIVEPADDTQINPAANISFPPPVYVVRDSVEIRGTVNLPTMRNFFVEFRPLILDETDALPGEERPWFPATLPQMQPVLDNVIGTWNTFTAPDGLYEIRLTINTSDGTPQFVRVSPIRVENELPPFLEDALASATATLMPTEQASGRPTLVPTPTAFDPSPRVVALVDGNVRIGDTTEYDRIGFLLAGESAPIVGISSFNTNWYYIQLPNGRRGFIAPSIVDTEGDLSAVPAINPPPPPTPPATATPIPTATPVTSANLVIDDVDLDPNRPRCDETYEITVTVKNTGSGATSNGGSISVSDTRTADGTVLESTIGVFPALDPGETFDSVMFVTVDTFYEEDHSINIRIDSGNNVPETNESDNTLTVVYELRRADC